MIQLYFLLFQCNKTCSILGLCTCLCRASIEPNFHDLYLKFFDKVNSKSLNKEIMKATYENCKVMFTHICLFIFFGHALLETFFFQQVLLRSDLIKSSSEERSLLKNLGSWLGKCTIGRNQTLRAKEIDPKILIVQVSTCI
jgi:CCR4-NOT transcription complex subunit 1